MSSSHKKYCSLLAGIFSLLAPVVVANNEPKDINSILSLVNKHCGSCHSVPSPALLPKMDWPFVIKIMGKLSDEKNGKGYLSEDNLKDITAYYYGTSPVSLPLLPYNDEPTNLLNIVKHEVGQKSKIPLIANIKSVKLADNGAEEFLVCDAEKKQLTYLIKEKNEWKETKLANVEIPIFTDVVDYDGDGDKDIIVTNLGEFPPSKRLVGSVLLLRKNKLGGYSEEVLIDKIPRATEARALDIDGDGDLDLAVSAFGGEGLGEIFWLENQGNGKQVKHVLLNISGGLNIIPVDLNGDGIMDFVSLVSQQYEMIVAFIGKGNKEFETRVISRAPHPMFGSTGLRLVDLDGDGDMDILFSNGDAFDTQLDPKPYHGVQWLENKGNLNFKFHDIGRSYGVASAVAADIDGDGDLDVIASSFINYWEDDKRRSLVWFENDGHQNFTQHNFLPLPKGIVSFELKDVSGNGRLDIIAGVFSMDILKKFMSGDAKKIEEAKNSKLMNTRFLYLENIAPVAAKQ